MKHLNHRLAVATLLAFGLGGAVSLSSAAESSATTSKGLTAGVPDKGQPTGGVAGVPTGSNGGVASAPGAPAGGPAGVPTPTPTTGVAGVPAGADLPPPQKTSGARSLKGHPASGKKPKDGA